MASSINQTNTLLYGSTQRSHFHVFSNLTCVAVERVVACGRFGFVLRNLFKRSLDDSQYIGELADNRENKKFAVSDQLSPGGDRICSGWW